MKSLIRWSKLFSHLSKIFISIVFLFQVSVCLAWGERGHDVSTRLAARLVYKHLPSEFSAPFLQKEFMLGHLSKVPDIVWRSSSQPASVSKAGGPTHYIGLDKLRDRPNEIQSYKISDFKALAKSKKLKLVGDVGTAPWRINQLFQAAVGEFQSAKKSKKKATQHIDQALLYLGIMSHFVGDLANPYHTTKDYDGWQSGQGGIHSYFETDCVQAYPVHLESDVWSHINKNRIDFDQSNKSVSKKNIALKTAFDLTLDSLKTLTALSKMDREQIIKKPSKNKHGLKVPALRMPSKEGYLIFRPFIVSRLSRASQTMAYLYRLAWEYGGKPNMSEYHSWVYPVKPEFIFPNY